jgi:hypothetical protein
LLHQDPWPLDADAPPPAEDNATVRATGHTQEIAR